MRFRDTLKPLSHHCLGIPKPVQSALKYLSQRNVTHIIGTSDEELLDKAIELYNQYKENVEHFEYICETKCPEERIERARELLAHMIVDLAYIHNCIASCGYQIEKFPYDDVADKVIKPAVERDYKLDKDDEVVINGRRTPQ